MIASVALVMNIVLIIALMTLLGATLTMPGIAGLVLAIGMAVDANVLIFERIREELRTARGPARAIELGFEKAFSPILDGNITTLIVAVILYLMGSGPVRGFGITLALGLICSMFTAIYAVAAADRHLVRLAAAEDGRDLRNRDALPDDPRRHRASTSSSRCGSGWRCRSSACSLTLVILPIRGLNYGVDFLGGTLILAEFPEQRDVGDYRAVLSGLDLGEVGGDRGLRRLGRARWC